MKTNVVQAVTEVNPGESEVHSQVPGEVEAAEVAALASLLDTSSHEPENINENMSISGISSWLTLPQRHRPAPPRSCGRSSWVRVAAAGKEKRGVYSWRKGLDRLEQCCPTYPRWAAVQCGRRRLTSLYGNHLMVTGLAPPPGPVRGPGTGQGLMGSATRKLQVEQAATELGWLLAVLQLPSVWLPANWQLASCTHCLVVEGLPACTPHAHASRPLFTPCRVWLCLQWLDAGKGLLA
ncbi:hypothetical protein V8C86DRAFT_1045419 [Haematococcus lacustris]